MENENMLKEFTVTYYAESMGIYITSTVQAENEERARQLYQPNRLRLEKVEPRKRNERNAGRKAKELPESVECIRERMKTESAKELAKEYGIGRTTLFKLLKQYEDIPEGNEDEKR